jgi:serine/threonine protein kinase
MTQAALPSATTPCLSEEDVLAFAAGRLSSSRREDAHRHLDACEDCQQLLNEAVHALVTARTHGLSEPNDTAWGTTFRPGVVLGHRYVVRRFIARGGMGEVYEAFDQELQQRVALKTVTSTSGDNPSAVRRLKAEVQLARRVSHPNVCRIYDFGTHQATASSAPLAFLTMEFVEGETLGGRLRRSGALPVAEAICLGRALLHGLAAAHAAGVLHRDFKSDNVLLRRDGERLEPFILDFGLARALDQADGQSSTSGRGLVGTLAYMAPEQLEGQPYTTATDVYSFGLVWFEMLTGELPFQVRSSPTVTTLERLTKPVPLPSSKNPLVPSDLDALVLACLRRCASERLQTAAAVLARLDELERRASEPRPKRRGLAALVAAGAVSSVAALAVLLGTEQAPSAPSLGVSSEPRNHNQPASHSAAGPVDGAGPQLVEPQVAPAPRHSGASARRSVPAGPDSTTPGAPLLAASQSKGGTKPAPTPPPRAVTGAEHGWENPFGVSQPTSAELGAVLNQPLDGRTSSGDSELPKGGR